MKYGQEPGKLEAMVVGEKDLVYKYVYGKDVGGRTYQASAWHCGVCVCQLQVWLGLGALGTLVWALQRARASLPPVLGVIVSLGSSGHRYKVDH